MSASVDVLAVLRAASANARIGVDLHTTAEAIDLASAAVAELIEAAEVFANDDRQHAWHQSYRPKMDALHAALARVGGAA